jgi:hypothetical protein
MGDTYTDCDTTVGQTSPPLLSKGEEGRTSEHNSALELTISTLKLSSPLFIVDVEELQVLICYVVPSLSFWGPSFTQNPIVVLSISSLNSVMQIKL